MEPYDKIQAVLMQVQKALSKPCTLVFQDLKLNPQATISECGLLPGDLRVVGARVYPHPVISSLGAMGQGSGGWE